MWRRYALFVVLSFGILMLNVAVVTYLNPPRKPDPKEQQKIAAGDDDDDAVPDADPKDPDQPVDKPDNQPMPEDEDAPAVDRPGDDPAAEQPEPDEDVRQPEAQPQWVSLGSIDPSGEYRMLVTLTSRGAAVTRIELSSPRFRDLEDRSGYLGHVAIEDSIKPDGCPVQVVGPGTPAATAGLKAGDLITAFDGHTVVGARSLEHALKQTRPGQSVEIEIARDGQPQTLSATLTRKPLEVVRPEGTDPLSFLFTISKVGSDELEALRKEFEEIEKQYEELTEELGTLKEDNENDRLDVGQLAEFEGQINKLMNRLAEFRREETVDNAEEQFGSLKALDLQLHAVGLQIDEIDPIDLEIDGINLRSGTWELVESSASEAVFRRHLEKLGLEVTKTYNLVKVPQESIGDEAFKGYHLTLSVSVKNSGDTDQDVAYQFDGPTGLPTEGYWYSNKVNRGWGAVGVRDVVVSMEGRAPVLVACPAIAIGKLDPPWWQDESLSSIGVDAQYFSAVMIPQKENADDIWLAKTQAILVGPVDPKWKKLANTSCRLISRTATLKPNESLSHVYQVFVGPKNVELIAQYGLRDLVYYGWFGPVAKLMLSILHFFFALVGNYGLSIIMLTVLVRSCMFPLSKKQALNAQKMAELQPEIKRIQEKYKKDVEGRTKAQQELFKKHNYNPLGGCLVMFLQLPIFIGLYRGLMVDVELRQAPLISEAVRWCSNLAAPDMLYDWSGFMPAFVTSNPGFLHLGPYFNILPIITIVFFIVQQKVLMPPPADEQAAMQQKIMKFMMIFFGILFFKVASGLCVYFIASSMWGLAERKLLPKRHDPNAADAHEKPKPPPRSGSARDSAAKKKLDKRQNRPRR